jgi:hypothetical protein
MYIKFIYNFGRSIINFQVKIDKLSNTQHLHTHFFQFFGINYTKKKYIIIFLIQNKFKQDKIIPYKLTWI